MPRYVSIEEFIENIAKSNEPFTGRQASMVWVGFGKQPEIAAWGSVNDAREASHIMSLNPKGAPPGSFHWWSGRFGDVALETGISRNLLTTSSNVDVPYRNGAGLINRDKFFSEKDMRGEKYLGWSGDYAGALLSKKIEDAQATGRITRDVGVTDQELLRAYAGLSDDDDQELPEIAPHVEGLRRVLELLRRKGSEIYYGPDSNTPDNSSFTWYKLGTVSKPTWTKPVDFVKRGR